MGLSLKVSKTKSVEDEIQKALAEAGLTAAGVQSCMF